MTVLPFLLRGNPVNIENQNEEPKPRSIILPAYLWNLVEKDAKRCRRSINKQIEAFFVVYYGVEASVNIDEEALKAAEQTPQKSRLKKTA